MGNFPQKPGRKRWRLGVLFALFLGVSVYYFTHESTIPIEKISRQTFEEFREKVNPIPKPLYPPMESPSEESRKVAAHHAGRQKGKIYFRHATPQDDDFAVWATPPSGPDQGWSEFAPGAQISTRTLFYLEPGAGVEVTTQSGWFTALNGEGQMIYDEVFEDSEKKNTLSVWRIKGGSFRARGYSPDPKLGLPKKYMKVITAKNQVIISEGEIGMSVGAGGEGSVWLSKGHAILIRADGKRETLVPQKKVGL